MKSPKILIAVQMILLLFGVVFVAVSVFWSLHIRQFVAVAQRTDGTVVDLELMRRHSSQSSSTTWAPRVQFSTPDGQSHQFISTSGSNPPSYSRGEHVGVLFEPDHPENARIDSFFSLWGVGVIFGAIGLVFLAIGAAMMLILRKGRARNSLLKTGKKIEARIQSVERNAGVSINGRSPFRILSQWQDPQTSLLHVFASENIWYDPTQFLHRESVDVYIEPANPKHYYVDTSFLPTPA